MAKKRTALKRIKHFLEYILVYSLYFILKNVSIDTASKIGSIIAKCIAPLAPETKIARQNLHFAFPELSNQEIEIMIKKMWDNICRTIMEMPHIHTMSDEEFNKRVEIIGNENMLKTKDHGAGICISSHMGNWEVAARTTLLYNDKVSIVYRKMNKPLLNATYLGMKNNKFGNIPKGPEGIKQLIEAIKGKQFICLLPDQYFDKGIDVNFFGKPAMTAKAPANLALKYNLPISFGYCVRTHGAHFKVYTAGPYKVNDLVKNLDNVEDKEFAITEKINEIIEGWIKKDPSQWCWIHKRWDREFYH